jgi:hypothetical protein
VSRMNPIAHCLTCGATYRYDPNTTHACDAPARAETMTPRGDDLAKRLAALEFEARSRLDALERQVQELEALLVSRGQDRHVKAASASAAAPAASNTPFNRRTYHATYMRAWRKRQTAAKRALRGKGEA